VNDAEFIALFIFTWLSQAAIYNKLMRCPNYGCCQMKVKKDGTDTSKLD
jgi:hypothetical protein